MKHSTDRILTTHAGSLSRPADLIALSRSIDVGEAKGNDPAYAQVLTAAVADVVTKQRELGVDIPDDGEFGKPMAGHTITAHGGTMPSRGCQGFRQPEARPLRHAKPSIRSQALPIWR